MSSGHHLLIRRTTWIELRFAAPIADPGVCNAFCGLPFIYNPYLWWPQHILSHHQYTNDVSPGPAPPSRSRDLWVVARGP